MPFSQQFFPKTKVTSHVVTIFIVGILTFLIGLGIGLGQGVKANAGVQSKGSDTQTLGSIQNIDSKAPSDVAKDVDFNLFWDIWRDIRKNYHTQPVDEKTLFYGALQGMANSLEDPYSLYFKPTEAQEFSDTLKGEFSGIGAEIGTKDDMLQVIAPLPDSPAEKAGVRSRDIIVKIDGVDSVRMPVNEAVMKIRGKKGTDVTLTLGTSSTNEGTGKSEMTFRDVTITRDTIVVKSAKLTDQGDGIFRIEIRSFNEDVLQTFLALEDEAISKNARKLIIDLRNDPGGYLDRCIGIVGEWVKNDVVVQERKQGNITERYQGAGRGILKGIPTVILVNGGSASASEIMAGALQDYGLATIVGEQTFGKGTVQDYMEYQDGSALKITIAEWLTPLGRSIQKLGIKPDVEVKMTVEDANAGRDPQLDKAIEILKSK